MLAPAAPPSAPPAARPRLDLPATRSPVTSSPPLPWPMYEPGRRVLGGVTWPTYEQLRLAPENDRYKLTYDGPQMGLLEIECPGDGPLGFVHESRRSELGLLLRAFFRHRRIDAAGFGRMTLARRDADRGLEADECYFLRETTARLRSRETYDLDAGDPPPQLALEVDLPRPTVDKLPILAALGVREAWVWRDDALTAHRLDGGRVREVAESVELPGFPLSAVAEVFAALPDAATIDL